MTNALDELRAHLERSPERPLPATLVAALRATLPDLETGNGARRRRDAALRRAGELIDPDRALGPWRLAERLAAAVAGYERRRQLGHPLGAVDLAIGEALASGARPVRTARGLFNVLPKRFVQSHSEGTDTT